MAKKRNTASEPILSSGAAPARTRKHAPAKRSTDPVVENSPSTDTITLAATLAEVGRKYPKATTTVKQGVEREQKRVRC